MILRLCDCICQIYIQVISLFIPPSSLSLSLSIYLSLSVYYFLSLSLSIHPIHLCANHQSIFLPVYPNHFLFPILLKTPSPDLVVVSFLLVPHKLIVLFPQMVILLLTEQLKLISLEQFVSFNNVPSFPSFYLWFKDYLHFELSFYQHPCQHPTPSLNSLFH